MFPNLQYFEYSVFIEQNSEEPKKVTESSFQALAAQSTQHDLRGLSITHPSLSDGTIFPAFQRHYSNLQFLSLAHTFFVEDAVWNNLFSSLKNLTSLHLGYSTIDDKSLSYLFDNTALCSSIQDFRLVAVQHVTNSIYARFDVFKHLHSLEVSLNNKFVNDQVQKVAEVLPTLRRFKSQNFQGTGEDAFKHFKILEELVLHDSDRLSDRAIKEISTGLLFLQHLDVNNCNHLTPASIDSLASSTSLRYLDVRFCSQLLKTLTVPNKMKKDFLLVQKNADLVKKGTERSCPCSLKMCCYFDRDNLSLLYH